MRREGLFEEWRKPTERDGQRRDRTNFSNHSAKAEMSLPETQHLLLARICSGACTLTRRGSATPRKARLDMCQRATRMCRRESDDTMAGLPINRRVMGALARALAHHIAGQDRNLQQAACSANKMSGTVFESLGSAQAVGTCFRGAQSAQSR